jgi:ClpP class serine protease
MLLLKHEVFTELRAAITAGLRPTADQQAQFTTALGRGQGGAEAPENYSVAGDTAQIDVRGVLGPRPSFLLWLLGYEQTTYGDIQRSLSAAALDANVKRVVMVVDSPGGQVDGLFDTLAALESFGKPVTVMAACACSAAYAIAAAAGPITATNAAAEFGSIGVAASVAIDDETVDITSTEAPNKRPDVTTEEGQAVIREHLDAIHELFADAIAAGRGTSVARVNAEFGRGSTLLAGAALQRGMVDGIAGRTGQARSQSRASASEELGPHMARALELCEHPGGALTAVAIDLCQRGAAPVKLLDIANRMSLPRSADQQGWNN